MKIRYICMEREYGSGGTEIGNTLARRLGIGCYGREIMEMVAKENETTVEALEEYEERVCGSILYSMFVMSQSQTADPDLVSREAKLYVEEAGIIRHLAKSGPAVFVGHCACKALEEEDGVLRVFIHGRDADRQRRAVEQYGIEPRQAAATCRRFDHRRDNYYNFCTRQKWSDFRNYDLVLDSSALGIDGCVEALTALWQLKNKE